MLDKSGRRSRLMSRPPAGQKTTIELERLETRELLSSGALLKVSSDSFNDTRYLTSVGNTAFFSAMDDEHGRELWRTDGTPSGTRLLKDINPGADGSYPHGFARVGAELYFVASNPQVGASLWKSDGTEVGTTMVANINPPYGGGLYVAGSTAPISRGSHVNDLSGRACLEGF
jgi:ELWxxDGT repeat protein